MALPRGLWKQFPNTTPPRWISSGGEGSVSQFKSWNNGEVIALARTRFDAPEHFYLFSPHDYVHIPGAEACTPPDDFHKMTVAATKWEKEVTSIHKPIVRFSGQSPPTLIESLDNDGFDSFEVIKYKSYEDGRVLAWGSWKFDGIHLYSFPPEYYIRAQGSEQCTLPDIWKGLQYEAAHPEASMTSSGDRTQSEVNRPGTSITSSQNNLIPQPSSFNDDEGWTNCLGYDWIDRFWQKLHIF